MTDIDRQNKYRSPEWMVRIRIKANRRKDQEDPDIQEFEWDEGRGDAVLGNTAPDFEKCNPA